MKKIIFLSQTNPKNRPKYIEGNDFLDWKDDYVLTKIVAIQKPIPIDPKREKDRRPYICSWPKIVLILYMYTYIYVCVCCIYTYICMYRNPINRRICLTPRKHVPATCCTKGILLVLFDPRKSPSQRTFGEPINDFFSSLSLS